MTESIPVESNVIRPIYLIEGIPGVVYTLDTQHGQVQVMVLPKRVQEPTPTFAYTPSSSTNGLSPGSPTYDISTQANKASDTTQISKKKRPAAVWTPERIKCLDNAIEQLQREGEELVSSKVLKRIQNLCKGGPDEEWSLSIDRKQVRRKQDSFYKRKLEGKHSYSSSRVTCHPLDDMYFPLNEDIETPLDTNDTLEAE